MQAYTTIDQNFTIYNSARVWAILLEHLLESLVDLRTDLASGLAVGFVVMVLRKPEADQSISNARQGKGRETGTHSGSFTKLVTSRDSAVSHFVRLSNFHPANKTAKKPMGK